MDYQSIEDSSSSGSNSNEEEGEEVKDLFEAVEKGDEEKAIIFMGQMNDRKTDKKITPLHKAVQVNRPDMVGLLLDNNAVINITDEDGNTPLHLAILNNHLEITKIMLQKVEMSLIQEVDHLIKQNIEKYPKWREIKNFNNPEINVSQQLSGTQTSVTQQSKYSSSGLKLSLHGTIFQLQLLMLFVHRARNEYRFFEIATEMDMAEKFDDVVIKYRKTEQDPWTWRFLQAKHKLNTEEQRITVNDLITDNHKGEFSLQKYFLSFCKIRANSEMQNAILEEFSLCTNTNLKFELSLKRKDNGDLTQDAVKYNNSVNKWKYIFSNFNNINNDKILYIQNEEVKIKKYNFDKCAESKLCILFKKNFLDKVDDKKIQQYKSIIKYLELYKCHINENTINANINEVKNILTNSNLEKTKLSDLVERFVKLNKDILTIDDFKPLEDVNSNLKKCPARNKKDKKVKQVLDEALKNVKTELYTVIKKIELKLAEFNEYLNSNSQKYKDLNDDINSICTTEKDVEIFLNDIKNFSTIEQIKANNNKYEKFVSKHFSDKIKNNSNFDEVKLLVQEKLQNAILELVAIKLLLNENLFDTYLKEFIEKFNLITNYPNVDELNKCLRIELGDDFKLLNADLVTNSFEKDILNWLKEYSKGQSNFLTSQNSNSFFKEIKSKVDTLMVSGLSKAYPEKLKTFGLQFINNCEWYNILKQVQCLVLITNITRLTAIDILQTLKDHKEYNRHDSYIFVRLRTLLQQKNFLLESFKSPDRHHLLIIEFQKKSVIKEDELNELLNELEIILKDQIIKKLIIISSDNIQISIKHRVEKVKLDFKKFNSASQKILLNKKCSFQGSDINLNQLINYKTATQICNSDSLNLIVEDKSLKIGNDEPFFFNDFIQEYYIDRNLHEQIINIDILTGNIELIFITGIDDIQLINLKVSKERIYEYKDDEIYTSGIVWCDKSKNEKNVFQNICTNLQTAHLLEHKNGTLYWKQSKGNYTNLLKYINTENNCIENYTHEDYFSSEEKIIVIANDTGMGKSTFFTSLARKLKDKECSKWIFRINLNDFGFDKNRLLENDSRNQMKSLNDITFKENNIEEAINFFTGLVTASNSIFEKKLLKFSLKVTKKDYKVPSVVILFDGFDEICPTYKNQTITLLKALSQSNVSQIFVSTRLHEKSLLEQELQTSALVLKQLETVEQIEFLDKFWRFSLKFFKEEDNQALFKKMRDYLENIKSIFENDVPELIKNISNPSLLATKDILRNTVNKINFKDFAKELLYKWKDKMNNDTFNIVPLHLRMLAEIVFYKNFEFIENLHILDLYNDFVEVKYKIFYDEKKNLGNTVGSKDIRSRDTTTLRKMFHILSLQNIFPDENIENIIKSDGGDIKEREKIPLARTGLLILKGTRLDFIHRSFAGYFLSEYAIIKFSLTNMQTLILDKILMENTYNFIRVFFNSQLERKKLSLENIELSQVAVDAIKIQNGFDNILHVVVHEGYIFILEFLMDKILKYPHILQKLLLGIGKYGPILDEIIHHPVRRSKSNDKTVKTIINKLDGHWDVLENVLSKPTETNGLILIGNQTSFTIIEKIIACKKLNLLETVLNDVKENSKVLKIILKSKIGLLNFASKCSTKLFLEFLDKLYDIIKNSDYLEELILETNCVNCNTILHELVDRPNTKLLKPFLIWLEKNCNNEIVKKLISAKNGYKFTALEIAVYKEFCKNTSELLIFFKNTFTDTIFEDINNPDKNILFNAIIQGKSSSTEFLLKWFYENIDHSILRTMLLTTSQDKRTALHLVCARDFDQTLEVLLKFFKEHQDLENIVIDMLLYCENDRTALGEAFFWKKYRAAAKLLEFLSDSIDRNNINQLIFKEDRYGRTIVHDTASSGTEIGLEMLLQFIIDNIGINALEEVLLKSDKFGNNALHNAVSRTLESNYITTKILLKFTEMLNPRSFKIFLLKNNNAGFTPLKVAKEEVIQYLKEKYEVILNTLTQEIVHFTNEELTALKCYLVEYSLRDNKETVIDLINNLMLNQS